MPDSPVATRTPGPGEEVIALTAAARRLGVSRQALDSALRGGRIEGFKNSDDGRLYLSLDAVERRASTRRDRVAELEAQILLLTDQLRAVPDAGPESGPRAGAGSQRLGDRSPATSEHVLYLILAAQDEQAAATAQERRAARRAKQQRRALRAAVEHRDEAVRLYREALKQYQTPDFPDL